MASGASVPRSGPGAEAGIPGRILHPGPGAGANVGAGSAEADSLYAQLGLSRGATDTEVRRAYRNLLTRAHPDKGGDPERFRRIQAAYDVLSDPSKRKLYDATGRVERTADQEFVERFAGGAFNDPVLAAAAAVANGDGGLGAGAVSGGSMADQIIVRHRSGEFQSHTAGFEAWMRSRGESGGRVFTAETVAEQFGVARASYDAVPLPRADTLQVVCRGPGPRLSECLALEAAPLPPELEWGHVLATMRAAPISAADTYTARLGGVYGSDTAPKLPYVAGHDGVGVVAKVGPGVKSLAEGDLVLPLRPFAGTWASAAVWPERSLLRLPQDGYGLPVEYLAMSRELVLAYQLLEQAGLKPGDAIILNAASSTVGQLLLQLARLLRLRAVAVVRPPHQAPPQAPSPPQARPVQGQRGDGKPPGGEGGVGGGVSAGGESSEAKWERTAAWLRSLGAAEVLRDEGSLRLELDRLRFFAKPRLALDAVGGEASLRLAEALAEGGELVVYGCMSGRPPALPWQAWVFRELRVRGFNTRRWVGAAPARMAAALEALAKLVRADLLSVAYTEYDITEWEEALEHAQERGKCTKVILKMKDPWVGQAAPLTATTAAAFPATAAAGGAAAGAGATHTKGGRGGEIAGMTHGSAAPINTPSASGAAQVAGAAADAFSNGVPPAAPATFKPPRLRAEGAVPEAAEDTVTGGGVAFGGQGDGKAKTRGSDERPVVVSMADLLE